MNATKQDARLNPQQRPTGGNSTGKGVLDAELYQAMHSISQNTAEPIIDCDARQMAEEINLGRMIVA